MSMTGTRELARGGPAPPVIAVALISAAALAYEILLMRLFSIILWHHFAYMIISLALLGYGTSGAVLTLAQHAVRQRFAPLFSAAAAAFGVSAIGCFVLAQRVPFNPLEILWDPRQPVYLLAVYLLLLLPFLCAGACVCMALSCFRGKVPRIYSFDILGAGAGSLGVVALLFVLSPADTLKLIGALGWAAAAVAWLECRGPRHWRPAALLMVMANLPLLLPPAWVAPVMSPYKELSQTLRIPETRVVEQRSSPLGLVSVVESPRIALRHAPGLSLNATAEPPPQLGVFIDGEGLNALTRFDGRRGSLVHLDQISSALPYHLLRHPRVLVLGAGAGADVLQAYHHGASQIDAVELNPQVVDLVRRRFADYAGGIYSRIARACGRGARLRRGQQGALRPHPRGAARLLQRFLGRPLRASRKLSLHGRSRAGRPAASAARRPAGDHTLGHAAAARCAQALCRRRAGAGAIGRRRSRITARPGAQLEDHHAARQERRLRRRGHRGDQGLLRRPLVRCGLLPRHAAGGGEPL
ncbi:hypothetical protein LP415_25450 [Polaromonas sp. P1(28)-8]|nr:hypothetical protein LP415_25450 [Polaromonas sp. P1(28)-8]